jgi:hypothetical protein
MPAIGRLLRIGYRSPGSEIGRHGSEIAASEIFTNVVIRARDGL